MEASGKRCGRWYAERRSGCIKLGAWPAVIAPSSRLGAKDGLHSVGLLRGRAGGSRSQPYIGRMWPASGGARCVPLTSAQAP